MRIVSGGQTGADRAALDAALELGLETGGWVPRGRLAEDGVIPDRYANLREAGSQLPAVRTELNVRAADVTVIFSHGSLGGGTALTERLARALAKPLLHLDLDGISEKDAAVALSEWLARRRPGTVNIAGPRESEDPAIYAAVKRVVMTALGPTAKGSNLFT